MTTTASAPARRPAPPRSSRERAARRRAIERRRRKALAVLGILAAVGYFLVMRAVLGAVWPTLPFPTADGLVAAAGVGFGFGLVIRRWWAVLLALAMAPLAAASSGSVLGGGLIGLVVGGPYAAIGLGGGVALGRARTHRASARRRARVAAPRARTA